MEVEEEVLRMNMSLLEDVLPINVTVKDLKVSTKGGMDIISKVNLSFKAGQVVGIMGSSGSGKTTLLNALSGRSSSDHMEGKILFNNSDSAYFHRNQMTAYVQQNDYLMPYLTVRECLQYTAELRLGTLSRKEKYRIAQDVILELGLKECADTIIGDDWRKGISGGERRRVSVAVQLLVNPSLIFLDEPTTGLDSFTANNLIKTLADLAKRGRTVFISIHQPRSDIYQLFDSLVLLSKGRLIYSGPGGNQMISYFDQLGYHVPMNTNPADFFIDVVSVDTRDEAREKETNITVDGLIEEWQKVEKLLPETINAADDPSKLDITHGQVEPIDDYNAQQFLTSKRAVAVNYFTQTWVLYRRAITNLKRDNLAVWGNLFEVVLFGSLMGAIFYKLSEELPGVLSRRSALYIVASMQTYLMLIFIIYKLANDMKVYDRERADNMYGTIPYMISQFFSTLPFNIIFPLIYSSIMYFMLGLRTDDLGFHFSRFYLANLVEQFIVVSFSYFCISIFRDFALASLLGNSLYTFFSFSTGFFQQLDSAPVYVRWIQKISFLTYQYRILAANEFSNNIYACTPIPQCDGNVILNQLGIKVDDFEEPFLAMCIIFIVFWILATIILMIRPKQSVKHAKSISTPSNDAKLEMHKRMQSVSKATKAARVAIELKNVTVELVERKSNSRESKLPRKILLDNVSARFPSKSLSIIIGGSGTGKSTLLSILAARDLNYGAMVKLKKSGDMLFDGTKKERRSEINQICAFVRQDDASLLSALTARETLHYQAQLRLPRSWTKQEKEGRAEEILGMLGLRHCADTVVGNETLKGLSGGEKRRLSIGVQILTDPSILVIDEPTSGLDAFTAHHIMMSLKNMAEAGRTIICSIHQPRSDIFPIFDNLMILTNGGRVAYSGPRASIFPFFESIGFSLPNHTNPCDFLLDICSIDLRCMDAETESKNRVEKILAKWNEAKASNVEGQVVSPMSSSEFSMANDEEVRRVEAPFHIAFPVLFSRSILNTRRQPILLFSRIMQVVSLGAIQALFYARQGDGQVSVQNKLGVIQQTLATFFVGLLNCVAVFPAERDILFRERADGIYSVGAYFLAYCLIEIPVGIISSIIYTLLVVALIGLNFTAETYWTATYAVFCLVATGESFGIAFCSLIQHIGFSISIANSVLGVFVIMSGIMSSDMPTFLDRINYISPIPYLTRLMTVNEFNSNTVITCTQDEINSNTCFYTNGSQVLTQLTSDDRFSFNEDSKLFYFGISLLLFIIFRIGSFLILKSSAH